MGPTPICQRVARSLARGQVALLPSDGLYMAVVSAGHCSRSDELDALCAVSANAQRTSAYWAFVRGADDLPPWGLELPEMTQPLLEAHWPGPLALIAPTPAASRLPAAFVNGRVELNCPEQSFMRQTLQALSELGGDVPPLLIGRPAHRPGALPVSSGRWLPQALGHRGMGELLDEVPFVIDAGLTQYGCLPTAVHCAPALKLVRSGPIDAAMLEETLGQPIEQALEDTVCESGDLQLITKHPPQGLAPVRDPEQDTWAIGVGPRPQDFPEERWIELFDEPHAFMAAYYNALALASDAGAKTVYVQTPNAELRRRIGLHPNADA